MRSGVKTALLLLAAAVSGCVSVLPSYDEALFKHLEALNDDLSKIDAAVGIVYDPPPSFSKVETFYVDAFAHLSEAEKIASGQRDYYEGRLAGRPADLIHQAILGCSEALRIQMDRHRQSPISKETLAIFAVDETCAIPKLMVGRLRRSS